MCFSNRLSAEKASHVGHGLFMGKISWILHNPFVVFSSRKLGQWKVLKNIEIYIFSTALFRT